MDKRRRAGQKLEYLISEVVRRARVCLYSGEYQERFKTLRREPRRVGGYDESEGHNIHYRTYMF